MGDIERRLLIEQTRKERTDEFKSYRIGLIIDGLICSFKDSELEDGHLFLVPDKIWKTWEE